MRCRKRSTNALFLGLIALFGLLMPGSARGQTNAFAYAADISWLPQIEANGYVFKTTSGVQTDCLTVLKGYGINAIRLRTWVNPSTDPWNGHCSEPETVAMIAMPLINWARLLTNQFDADGNFNFTNSINTNWPQSFYVLQLP